MSDLPAPPPPSPPPPPPPPGGFGNAPPPGYGSTYGAPTAPSGELAGFWARFAAKLIDSLILTAVAFVAFVPAIVVVAAGPDHVVECRVDEEGFRDPDGRFTALCEEPTGATIAAAVLVGLVGLAAVVWLSVYYFRREGRTGQAWGRTAMGIRLVDAGSGTPIGGGRAFGRAILAGTVSSWICYLGYLWMLWDARKQTWHDKIVTSVVVKA